MDLPVIKELLAKIPHKKIAVVGDFCVDVYWDLNPAAGEISLETGLKTTPVTTARYAPGGAGNIVANLRAMGLQEIPCAGAWGSDPFGHWMNNYIASETPECTAAFLKICRPEYHTPVYCKPLLDAKEQSRLDLGNTPLSDEESLEILDQLRTLMPQLEVVIINEQLSNGLHSEYFRKKFAELVKEYENRVRFVFDGRACLDAYPGVILKINAEAASRLAFGNSRGLLKNPAKKFWKPAAKSWSSPTAKTVLLFLRNTRLPISRRSAMTVRSIRWEPETVLPPDSPGHWLAEHLWPRRLNLAPAAAQ